MQELVNEALLAEDARAVEQAKCVGMTLLLQVHPFQADLRSPIVEVPHLATIAFVKRRIHAGTRYVSTWLLQHAVPAGSRHHGAPHISTALPQTALHNWCLQTTCTAACQPCSHTRCHCAQHQAGWCVRQSGLLCTCRGASTRWCSNTQLTRPEQWQEEASWTDLVPGDKPGVLAQYMTLKAPIGQQLVAGRTVLQVTVQCSDRQHICCCASRPDHKQHLWGVEGTRHVT